MREREGNISPTPRVHARVIRRHQIPPAGLFVPAATREYPGVPPQNLNGKEGSTVRVRQRASAYCSEGEARCAAPQAWHGRAGGLSTIARDARPVTKLPEPGLRQTSASRSTQRRRPRASRPPPPRRQVLTGPLAPLRVALLGMHHPCITGLCFVSERQMRATPPLALLATATTAVHHPGITRARFGTSLRNCGS